MIIIIVTHCLDLHFASVEPLPSFPQEKGLQGAFYRDIHILPFILIITIDQHHKIKFSNIFYKMYTEYLNGKNIQESVNTSPSPLKRTQSIVSSTHEIVMTPTSTCGGVLYIFLSFAATIGFIILGIYITARSFLCYVSFVLAFVCFMFAIEAFSGFTSNEPNEAKVLTFYGKYRGTIKQTGMFWIFPFYTTKKISLRSNNLNGEVIKINDKNGNPIKAGCVVVWRVHDTAKAIFNVQDYFSFVSVQAESALRNIGCKYPYDKQNEDDICLKSGHDIVNNDLKNELIFRLEYAGIDVEESRITELSYSTEIANAMLKRQAADAVVAARQTIVNGAMSIVEDAVKALKENNICEFTQKDKEEFVKNMLVVLSGEAQVTPIVKLN